MYFEFISGFGSFVTFVTFAAELEWMLSEKGAVKTSLGEDPRKKRKAVRDVMSEAMRRTYRDAEDSDDDSD